MSEQVNHDVMRDARPRPVPVVPTVFRPTDRTELAANPFRMFTSVLVPEDRHIFDADLETRLKNALRARRLFSAELLDLADSAAAHGELEASVAGHFLDLAVSAFALSSDPVDQAWYAELEAGVQQNLEWMSGVVGADIYAPEELYPDESATSLAGVRELLPDVALTPSKSE